ncbi:LexA family protein [Legionella israelensis]|uniref:HTH-type transcriptional regulator n=1 Tax=Legionella israelensis TaxID=454 RepID=A0A0W0WK58_9GAMM|nr:S24 family peptidase [Legionella israelensis]KTD32704.1 HTH-type transcriptional regulator [Legionella israelensis]QBS08987.1 helix-turn-helix domain-containing protein [Legionella israelensis]SCY35703.1 Peptidase S24-like [Legionella israelensis DSM 19235]STX58682.1 HTH-type transcriptional regulator [Legionella israelensis]
MTQSTLSHNLQQLMRIHGNLSVSELARLTNIPQPTVHHLLSGATKNPRKKALEALSNFFSVSIEQLIGEVQLPKVIPENIKEDLQLRTIPIIEWEILRHWPQIKTSYHPTREIFLDKILAPDSFALVIQDASMEPLFPSNALLIFDIEKKPQDRDFVIVYINKSDSVLFNRLFTENNVLYLKQNLENGDVKLTKLDENTDRIIGTLIEARIQY